jgi:hypothetical protein
MDNPDNKPLWLNLAKSPGWKLLEIEINTKVDIKRRLLESCRPDELVGYQSEIRGLKFALQKVEEQIREDKDENI